jgi:flagellin
MRINTNIASIQAQTSLSKVTRDTDESYAKLSSGKRINKAADDAAGLAISEKINAEVRSSRQANRNANDGVSLVQVAEGGLSEASSILTRMRELAIQAANDTLGEGERYNLSLENEALKSELDRISRSTSFNGRKLLDGSGSQLDFQVGTGGHSFDDQVSYRPDAVNARLDNLGVASVTVTTKESAQSSLSQIDSAINKISSQRSILGSIQNRLVSSSNNLMIYTQNMDASNSRIRDLDYADETAKQARNTIVGQAGTAVLAQANLSGQSAIKLVE